WFTSTPLARPLDLSAALQRALGPGSASFTAHDVAPGTLHGLVGRVNVSFLELRYRRLRPLLEWREVPCRVASLDDLACMKLGAAVQRGSRKDFVDVYALGTAHRPLRDLLRLYRRKFEIDDIGHVLVGLSYFDDAERTPMPRMLWRVSWRAIRTTIESWVKETSG
ncbi:MAG TPA: nucleotidyl transferase AbiEii/AbiGii toxin family protein, partial [Chloroflexota bacterium]|nr:nucleotidyl transferase AbiEii/AbiGii toxin family protein [Chloroflexota bacterium]